MRQIQGKTDPFPITICLHQGSTTRTAFCFALVMDALGRNQVRSSRAVNMLFVGDIVLVKR